VVPISGGKDPDEIARGEGGRERWLALLAEAQQHGVVKNWLEGQRRKNPRADGAAMRRWVAELAPIFHGLPDELIRQEVVQEVCSALHLGGPEAAALLRSAAAGPVQGGQRSLETGRGGPGSYREVKQGAQQRAMLTGASNIEREIVRRLLNDEQFRFIYCGLAQAEWFEDPALRTIYAALLHDALDGLHADAAWAALLAELSMAEPLLDDDEKLLRRHRNLFLQREIQRLLMQCQAASQAGDVDLERSLIAEVQRLKGQMR
jgi:hypothetical protein